MSRYANINVRLRIDYNNMTKVENSINNRIEQEQKL
jgi:hypothetical protein